ncbi:ABC transporter permease [Nocardioides sp. DS6]|uniref:ABC transporter permease n=2 Tax=Nocardioides eburneus TaxID=3231482 RepID=A0ABV3SWV4_9ACTN
MSDLLIAPLNLMPRIHLGNWVNSAVEWLTTHWSGFFNGIGNGLNSVVAHLTDALMSSPIFVVVIVLAVIALLARGIGTAIAAAIGLLLIDSFNEWSSAMQTLALIVVAAVIAIVLSIPIGIVAAKSRIGSMVVRPVLDFMQTLPAYVYLLPALFFFGLGSAAGVVATIIFAMPPGVRLTELGIRQVDSEMVEAGQAFGAPPGKVLFGIQIPLAMPTIMAGVNQVIMLALSMVVIGGMVGAPGLGQDVTSALTTLDIGKGAEAGVSVVFLAIYLDRVTAGLGRGEPSPLSKAVRLFQRQRASAQPVAS